MTKAINASIFFFCIAPPSIRNQINALLDLYVVTKSDPQSEELLQMRLKKIAEDAGLVLVDLHDSHSSDD